ncbi:hypothetical protein BAUCODRAFT_470383 [Baudoinia panamericana UAMH 10762]|uniref:Uncharacterized protein n=1 Tax=Baudoinia panamericana (strain UAMH 10762) TaxID=717646 RepID=M2MI39_BAUPA|nr:uncharacterized protein BAUCODRAFT_470383 [Baudoinia panamericana UAMH 10762]EMC96321.1 hypothetical protein BAUCODRAFT_470383 [Baudoinia panamericana UAMH 10762]
MAPSRGFQRSSYLNYNVRYYISQSYRTIEACPSCLHQRRPFTTSPPTHSGHNRWSKIKHDKLKTDAAKNRARSIFAQEIATASKLFGPEPNSNARLADLITKAKREGFAKTSIEAAIARGQGRSTSGASLESVTVEGILRNNVGVIVECETDSKLRTLADVRLIMKENGGSATPCSYLFRKKGRIVFEAKEGVGVEEALDAALEAGAMDVEDDGEGRIVVSTEPEDTKSVGEAVANALSLQIATSEILWEPNEETKVGVPDEQSAQELSAFLDDLEEREASLQAVAMNVAQGSLEDAAWKDLQARLSS